MLGSGSIIMIHKSRQKARVFVQFHEKQGILEIQ